MRCMNALVASSKPANRMKQHNFPTQRCERPTGSGRPWWCVLHRSRPQERRTNHHRVRLVRAVPATLATEDSRQRRPQASYRLRAGSSARVVPDMTLRSTAGETMPPMRCSAPWCAESSNGCDGAQAALAQLRDRPAARTGRGAGRTIRRLPVVVPAHHLRPLRQVGDAQR
jgi:hypothetical protein